MYERQIVESCYILLLLVFDIEKYIWNYQIGFELLIGGFFRQLICIYLLRETPWLICSLYLFDKNTCLSWKPLILLFHETANVLMTQALYRFVLMVEKKETCFIINGGGSKIFFLRGSIMADPESYWWG